MKLGKDITHSLSLSLSFTPTPTGKLKLVSNLVGQRLQAGNKAIPEVAEERSIDLLQAFLGAGVYADVQLGNGYKIPARHAFGQTFNSRQLQHCQLIAEVS